MGTVNKYSLPKRNVVGHDVWDTLGAHRHLGNPAELVLGLLSLDAVDDEAALHIIENSEEFVSSVNGDDIHKPAGVGLVSAHFPINFDKALHDDLLALIIGQGVLQTVTQKDSHGKTLPGLVGTSTGLGGKVASK